MNISKTWDIDPMSFMSLVDKDVGKSVLSLAEKVFFGVVSRTPTYTGNLRASWVASLIESNTVVVGGGRNSVLPPPSFPLGSLGSNPKTIYVMNSTPYAGLVEFGGPKNIPRAMVQNTLNSL